MSVVYFENLIQFNLQCISNGWYQSKTLVCIQTSEPQPINDQYSRTNQIDEYDHASERHISYVLCDNLISKVHREAIALTEPQPVMALITCIKKMTLNETNGQLEEQSETEFHKVWWKGTRAKMMEGISSSENKISITGVLLVVATQIYCKHPWVEELSKRFSLRLLVFIWGCVSGRWMKSNFTIFCSVIGLQGNRCLFSCHMLICVHKLIINCVCLICATWLRVDRMSV